MGAIRCWSRPCGRPRRAAGSARRAARRTRPPRCAGSARCWRSRATPPATGESAEEVLWRVWQACGLEPRWSDASARGGPVGAAADRDLDAVLALFDAAARTPTGCPAPTSPPSPSTSPTSSCPGDSLAAARPAGRGGRAAHRARRARPGVGRRRRARRSRRAPGRTCGCAAACWATSGWSTCVAGVAEPGRRDGVAGRAAARRGAAAVLRGLHPGAAHAAGQRGGQGEDEQPVPLPRRARPDAGRTRPTGPCTGPAAPWCSPSWSASCAGPCASRTSRRRAAGPATARGRPPAPRRGPAGPAGRGRRARRPPRRLVRARPGVHRRAAARARRGRAGVPVGRREDRPLPAALGAGAARRQRAGRARRGHRLAVHALVQAERGRRGRRRAGGRAALGVVAARRRGARGSAAASSPGCAACWPRSTAGCGPAGPRACGWWPSSSPCSSTWRATSRAADRRRAGRAAAARAGRPAGGRRGRAARSWSTSRPAARGQRAGRGRAPAAGASTSSRPRSARSAAARARARRPGGARLVYLADQKADGQAKEPVQPPLDDPSSPAGRRCCGLRAPRRPGRGSSPGSGPTATAARSAPRCPVNGSGRAGHPSREPMHRLRRPGCAPLRRVVRRGICDPEVGASDQIRSAVPSSAARWRSPSLPAQRAQEAPLYRVRSAYPRSARLRRHGRPARRLRQRRRTRRPRTSRRCRRPDRRARCRQPVGAATDDRARSDGKPKPASAQPGRRSVQPGNAERPAGGRRGARIPGHRRRRVQLRGARHEEVGPLRQRRRLRQRSAPPEAISQSDGSAGDHRHAARRLRRHGRHVRPDLRPLGVPGPHRPGPRLRLGDPALARLREWPVDGEIDIMEVPVGATATRRTSCVHSGDGRRRRSSAATMPGDFSQWHTFAVDWLPDRITWYVDGVEPGSRSPTRTCIPDKPDAPDDPARPGAR